MTEKERKAVDEAIRQAINRHQARLESRADLSKLVRVFREALRRRQLRGLE